MRDYCDAYQRLRELEIEPTREAIAAWLEGSHSVAWGPEIAAAVEALFARVVEEEREERKRGPMQD